MFKKLFTLALISIIILACTHKVQASHAAGGELVYEWISDSTYRFIFKFYRDCSGAGAPGLVQLCGRNTCNNVIINGNLERVNILPDGKPNGSSIANGCPTYKNKCTDISVSIPGYQEWWYVDTLTLPSRCNSWTFSVSINARNPSVNLFGTNLVIVATLNNLDALKNSSPFFTVKPVPYVCINAPYVYNNGVVDNDNDSLSFELHSPISSINCSNTPFIRYCSFGGGNPPISLPNNPFQTNNTFSLNSTNGHLTFTPASLGAQTISFVAKEYRNGKLIGSVVRDIQIQVLNCTTPLITLNIDSTSIKSGVYQLGKLKACYGQKLDFCFDLKSSDSGTILTASDNHNYSLPGAIITYTNISKDSVRGCINWTPSILDTGLKVLTITVKDSTCKAPGIAVTQTFTLPIEVDYNAPPPIALSPISLCKDEIAKPLTAIGNNLLWFTSQIGSNGSYQAPTPKTNILGQDTFYVTQVPNGCTSARVPIVVNVNQGPYLNLTTSKDTLCELEAISIYNNITNNNLYLRSWDIGNGRVLYGNGTDSITADWTTPGSKTITITITSPVCSVSKSVDIYVIPTTRSFFEMKHNACLGEEVEIIPYKQDSAYYYWTIEEQKIHDTLYVPLYKFKWNKTGKKRITLHTVNRNGCTGPIYDTVIGIHDYPNPSISGPDFNDICYGKEFELSVQEGSRYKYEWTPPLQFISYNKNKATARAEQTGFLKVKVSNFWNCSAVDSFYIDASPCCDVIMPDAFSPDGNGLNDYYRPLKASNHTIISFSIKNRWGQTIYETKDISRGWNGRFKGEPQDIGTYFYYLKYLCNGGTEEQSKKGNFTLIK